MPPSRSTSIPLRQRTFTIIPAIVHSGTDLEDSKPMTSKQVKKRFSERQKGLYRRSRSEERRFEREEQARISREHEEEKKKSQASTNRARVKKKKDDRKLKMEEVRRDRARKGLPPVAPPVAQGTLTSFVTMGKKLDDAAMAQQKRSNQSFAEKETSISRIDIPFLLSTAATSMAGEDVPSVRGCRLVGLDCQGEQMEGVAPSIDGIGQKIDSDDDESSLPSLSQLMQQSR